RAEHHVVARRAPRGLLGDLGVRQAVLVEQLFFLGDDQRRGIGERDEAQLHLLGLRTSRLGEAPDGSAVRAAPSKAAVAVAPLRTRAASKLGHDQSPERRRAGNSWAIDSTAG